MKQNLSRRDFLKLSGLLSLGMAAPRILKDQTLFPPADKQNVLIIVFDALSALNISFYGYSRDTTPNLARLAKRAVVYHNHFAGSNFTTPGTATLLTGTLPWTHRAMQSNAIVADAVEPHNIFHAFQGYNRIAYTHNGWAYRLLKQFRKYIDELIPQQKLFLESYAGFVHSLFNNDDDIATVSWARDMEVGEGYSYSLLLAHLYKALQEGKVAKLKAEFPRGIPSTYRSDNSFLLEEAVDWTGKRLTTFPQPFMGYFHFLPPHDPYRTSIEFYRRFANDGMKPINKPMDIFADKEAINDSLKERTEYDEFVLYADKAFGDLFKSIEDSGLLDNTWVIFTSDHGEMFERGMTGHGNPALYQSVIRIPLLIFEPGKSSGENIHIPTSAIDLLPTLLHVTGHQIPDWTEGTILPPYSKTPADIDRSIYAVYAKKTKQDAPLTNDVSATMIKGKYKLIYCFGYPKVQNEIILLFDIESDPEELTDLSSSMPKVTGEMLAELKSKLAEVNKPYQQAGKKTVDGALL